RRTTAKQKRTKDNDKNQNRKQWDSEQESNQEICKPFRSFYRLILCVYPDFPVISTEVPFLLLSPESFIFYFLARFPCSFRKRQDRSFPCGVSLSCFGCFSCRLCRIHRFLRQSMDLICPTVRNIFCSLFSSIFSLDFTVIHALRSCVSFFLFFISFCGFWWLHTVGRSVSIDAFFSMFRQFLFTKERRSLISIHFRTIFLGI